LWRDTRPRTTEYGAIVGLTAMGPRAIEHLVLPKAADYLNGLNEEEQRLLSQSAGGGGGGGGGGGKKKKKKKTPKEGDAALLNVRKCTFAM